MSKASLCSQGDTQIRSCLVHLPKYTQFPDGFFTASMTGCQRKGCQGEILYDEILPHLFPLTRTLFQGWGWIDRQKGGARAESQSVPHLPIPVSLCAVWRFDFLCSEGRSLLQIPQQSRAAFCEPWASVLRLLLYTQNSSLKTAAISSLYTNSPIRLVDLYSCIRELNYYGMDIICYPVYNLISPWKSAWLQKPRLSSSWEPRTWTLRLL